MQQSIAIDASRYRYPTPTGVEVYSDRIIDQLLIHAKEENIQVTLLTQKYLEIDPEFSNVTQEVIPGKFMWTLRLLTKYFFKNKRKFSALFVPSHILPLSLPKKSVVTIHDVAHRHFPGSYSRKQWWMLEFSTRFSVKFATTIIVISEATKQDLLRFYNCPEHKIKVIPLGFDKEQFVSSFKDTPEVISQFGLTKGKYLQFIGRVEEKKNSPLLVEAFLKANIPSDWKLILVGKDGVGYEKVNALLKQDMDGRVIKAGFQSNDVNYSLLKNAGGFVFPSKFEGFGLPILEAYSLGVPVLCSTAGALPEVAGDGADFIQSVIANPPSRRGEAISVGDMKNAIEAFVAKIEKGETDPAKGQKQLEKFSWKKAGEETWKIISRI